MSGTSSSGMRTETRLVEPTVIPSATNLENPMLATHDSSEPTHAPETDETHDKESPDMETDDPDTMTSVPEPPPVLQSAAPSLLPRHRVHGKRESAVEHERSVKPRIELPEEDELFVSSQLQSFREQVQEHVNGTGAEGIGAYTVFSKVSNCQISEATSRDDSHIVFLMSKALGSHLTCRGAIWRNSKRNRTPLAISLLQRFARVQR